jgi:hypothetical protein
MFKCIQQCQALWLQMETKTKYKKFRLARNIIFLLLSMTLTTSTETFQNFRNIVVHIKVL